MARIVSEKPKATLSDALKAIEKNGLLHEALKDGFIKLYGYTSDADGIRHAMLDEPTLRYNQKLWIAEIEKGGVSFHVVKNQNRF